MKSLGSNCSASPCGSSADRTFGDDKGATAAVTPIHELEVLRRLSSMIPIRSACQPSAASGWPRISSAEKRIVTTRLSARVDVVTTAPGASRMALMSLRRHGLALDRPSAALPASLLAPATRRPPRLLECHPCHSRRRRPVLLRDPGRLRGDRRGMPARETWLRPGDTPTAAPRATEAVSSRTWSFATSLGTSATTPRSTYSCSTRFPATSPCKNGSAD